MKTPLRLRALVRMKNRVNLEQSVVASTNVYLKVPLSLSIILTNQGLASMMYDTYTST